MLHNLAVALGVSLLLASIESVSAAQCQRRRELASSQKRVRKEVRRELASSQKRVRKEVRKLTKVEWNRVVTAIHVMKFTSQEDGILKYGPYFRSYDSLVAQHATAALTATGDAAHFQPVFPIYHRAWTAMFENALLSVDSRIPGLPYWNFALDIPSMQGDDSNNKKTVFSDEYFGSTGTAENDYVVTDGRFAYWPISNDTKQFGLDWSSPFGLLRSPVSVNNAPFVTRRLGSLCGVRFDLGDPTAYSRCTKLKNPDISAFRQCIDPTLHGPAHLFVGGSWKRDSQKGLIDSLNCAQWIGQIRPQLDNNTRLPKKPFVLGSFINAYTAGCLVCPQDGNKCDLEENPDSCVCIRKDPTPKACGPLWTGLADRKDDFGVTLAPCSEQQIIGDFVDATTSPNDVIFAFHHSNLDRVFTNWMAGFEPEDLATTEYFGYPEMGYGYGGNLDDTLNPEWPLVHLVVDPSEDHSNPKKWTARNVFEATYPTSRAPYVYEQAAVPRSTGPGATGQHNRRQSSTETRSLKQQKASLEAGEEEEEEEEEVEEEEADADADADADAEAEAAAEAEAEAAAEAAELAEAMDSAKTTSQPLSASALLAKAFEKEQLREMASMIVMVVGPSVVVLLWGVFVLCAFALVKPTKAVPVDGGAGSSTVAREED